MYLVLTTRCNSNIMKAGAVRVKGLVYGMSGILIPCLSGAALPEFMALCIRQQDVRGPPSKKDFNLGTHKNDTLSNNLFFGVAV